MRILVTGGGGFIGSHVVEALSNRGDDVAIIDDFSAGRAENLADAGLIDSPQSSAILDARRSLRGSAGDPPAPSIPVVSSEKPGRFEVFLSDIRDPMIDSIFEQFQPQVVLHLAAQIDVRKSVADPVYDASVNILGTINLLQACRHHGVERFVFTSSGGCVYGEPENLPVAETHPRRPDSPYGISKEVMTHYLDFYGKEFDISHVTLALANIYGPRQDPMGEAGVIAIFIGQMMDGQRPTIFGDGEQERDFVFVEDVVAAYVAAIEQGDGDFLNIGTSIGTNVNQLYEKLAELASFDGNPNYGPPRLGELKRIYLDPAQAREVLGWRPQTSIDEGLSRTYQWFSAQPKRGSYSKPPASG